jgi:transcriptional regulator with XRE-family HTH domain
MLYQEKKPLSTEARNLRQLRRSAHLTQTELGEIIHRSAPTVCSYEKGDTPIPRKALEILADYFHTSVDSITGQKTEERREDLFDFTNREMRMILGFRQRSKGMQDAIFRLATTPENNGGLHRIEN